MRSKFPSRLLAVVLFLAACERVEYVLPPEAGAYFQSLLPSSSLTKQLDIGLVADHAMFRFKRESDVVEFELRHRSTCWWPTGPFCVSVTRREGPGHEGFESEARAALSAALRQSGPGPTWIVPQKSEASSIDWAAEWKRLRERANWRNAGATLFAGLFLALAGAAWVIRREAFGRSSQAPAMIALLAVCLRFMAHPGPADIRSVLDEAGTRRAGWVAFLQLIHTTLPDGDETMWMINRLVGGVSVALLFVVVRRRFLDPMVSTASALALALTPLIVRFSASDTPYILVCAGMLAVVWIYDRFFESGSIVALGLGLGVLTATMQLRPESTWLVVPCALLALGRESPEPRIALRRCWAHLCAAPKSSLLCILSFLSLNGALAFWSLQGESGAHDMYLTRFVLWGALYGSPWIDFEMSPWPLSLLVAFGASLAFFASRVRPAALWLLATVIAWPLEFSAIQQYANARYHLPSMYLACALVGLAVAWLIRQSQTVSRRVEKSPTLAAFVLIALAASPRIDLLWRMWTPQREFELFRDGLARVDKDCRIATLRSGFDSGFDPFAYLVPGGLLLNVTEVPTRLQPDECVVFYRCGDCFTADLVPPSDRADFKMNPGCIALESRFELEPLLEEMVPALPYRGEMYVRDPLPLGFYRLRSPLEPARAEN